MLRFGFEREFFVLDEDDNPTLVPNGVPHDAGLLAEARGTPADDPVTAAFDLLAKVYRIRKQLNKVSEGDLRLAEDLNVLEVPPEVRIQARRQHQKGLVNYQNLYGHERHPVAPEEMTAGVHVSVTRQKSYSTSERCKCGEHVRGTVKVNTMFDYGQFIRMMDEEFAEAIREANRLPGFYEIKSDGRVEYRSLPQNIDIRRVADFLEENISTIHGSW